MVCIIPGKLVEIVDGYGHESRKGGRLVRREGDDAPVGVPEKTSRGIHPLIDVVAGDIPGGVDALRLSHSRSRPIEGGDRSVRFAQKTARRQGRGIVVTGDLQRGVDSRWISAERAGHRERNVSSLAINIASVGNTSERTKKTQGSNY